jgi:hypothetical protein
MLANAEAGKKETTATGRFIFEYLPNLAFIYYLCNQIM